MYLLQYPWLLEYMYPGWAQLGSGVHPESRQAVVRPDSHAEIHCYRYKEGRRYLDAMSGVLI